MLLAFDSICGDQNGVGIRVIAFDSLSGGRTGVPRRPSTISTELEQGLENVYQPLTGLAILTSNVYSVFV